MHCDRTADIGDPPDLLYACSMPGLHRHNVSERGQECRIVGGFVPRSEEKHMLKLRGCSGESNSGIRHSAREALDYVEHGRFRAWAHH